MKKLLRKSLLILGLLGVQSVSAQPFSAEFKKSEVLRVMEAVADWQIAHQANVKHGVQDWTNATLYLGMSDWAALAEKEKGTKEYYDWLKRIGDRVGWQPAKRMYHADDICISQMYIDLYRRFDAKKMLDPTIARTDWVMKNPSEGPMILDYRKSESLERWTWCDALFMAPPVYARLYNMTGDKRYLRFMNEQYRDTYDLLYDKDEHLFYRDARYIGQKEANGAKIFWARGNGWVLGGLCEILQELPAKEKSREFYENLFIEMASRIKELQLPDGYWRASLLDPDSYPSPETSGTGFFVYALAYGIRTGLLPADEYMPALKKGWEAMVKAVEETGKLGYVQPIGADPKKVTRDMTEVYGVGALLLAGTQIFEMSE